MMRPAALALIALLSAGCTDEIGTPVGPNTPTSPAHPDHALFLQAARSAWSYVDRQYQPETGLVNSVADYPYATIWDIASSLGALYSARQLDLVADAEYDRRMRRALQTLQTMPLFEGVTFNKNYSTRTAAMAGLNDRDTQATERGIGWSSTDLGRLLVWLRIIAVNEPRYAADVQRIVSRTDFSAIVAQGYLWGGSLDASARVQRYPEGRVGYEQYAAAGFELWNQRAEKALRLSENAIPITVMGVPLVADRRGHDYLTSEPFVLMGLELGWGGEMGDLAARVLKVQEERHRRTGQVTIVSEDAIPQPPHYFYYYAINYHGNQFVVGAQDTEEVLTEPRWVSAKSAFAWHALLPGGYTRLAVDAVAPAGHPQRGWSSGVYERTGASTAAENLNTAAVILEAALYSKTGRPLLSQPQ